MAYENLLKSVEESAQEKQRELQLKAQKEAEGIRSAAKTEADEIIKRIVGEATHSAAIERNKQIYLAKGAIKEQALRSREQIFDAAFKAAGNRLTMLREESEYPAIFKRLAEEAIGLMGGTPYVLHVDPRDRDLCTKTLTTLGISSDIRADLDCMGGLVASSPDGLVSISNTVESRLLRVREHKRLEIFHILAGG